MRTGSDIFSNDLLAKVEYPDATTGDASTSASDDVTYTYDALGEETSMTDQNGTTHDYTYDSLGRQTLDSVVTLGSGVDGTVRALGTNYNSQGLPYQETSYSNANGTGVVNEDQDVYNGLGQLTGEYQSVSGAVNTSTTPEVQYAYSDPDIGSRMTSMTYPNGRVVDSVYNSGIDNAIGRVVGHRRCRRQRRRHAAKLYVSGIGYDRRRSRRQRRDGNNHAGRLRANRRTSVCQFLRHDDR